MQAQPVSYRTTGEVVSALLRGDAAFAVELYHAIRGQVDAGALQAARGGDAEALGGDPNVPTVAESGIRGFGLLGWYGLVFPAGTPQPIIDKMRKALQGGPGARERRASGSEGGRRDRQPVDAGGIPQGHQSDIKGFREVASKAGLEAK